MGWEALQKEVNITVGPLLTRGEYYKNGIEILRNAVTKYFLNTSVAGALLEVAGSDEQLFDFNKFEEKMKACMASEETLVQYAGYWHAANGVRKANRTLALNNIILNGNLPLKDVEGSFQLNLEQPFTPKAHVFMQQFAHILTIYRVYVGIVDTYQTLLNYPFLNTPEHFKYLIQAQSLEKQISQCEDEDTLRRIFKRAKASKKEIKNWLEPSMPSSLYVQKEEFENAFLLEITNLIQLFEEGKQRLENCYREFPNDSYTCWLYDTNWQALLKSIAGYFFNNQYTYWSSTSTLTILPHFIPELCTEISNVHGSALEKQLDFKVELLSASLKAFDDILIKARVTAAKQNISLLEAPEQSIFNQESGNTIYHLYYQLILQWEENAKELKATLNDNEEISADDGLSYRSYT